MSAHEIDLSPWADKDPLTLEEAAYLWAGLPPNLLKKQTLYPERCAAASERARQLQEACEAGTLEYERPIVPVTKNVVVQSVPIMGWGGEFSGGKTKVKQTTNEAAPWRRALLSRAALRVYADSIGKRPLFLFPEAENTQVLRCLDPSNPHFSDELAAAFLAWQYASEMAEGAKKKPRQLIEDWLKKSRPAITPGSKAYERIATLSNWEKTPGAKALK